MKQKKLLSNALFQSSILSSNLKVFLLIPAQEIIRSIFGYSDFIFLNNDKVLLALLRSHIKLFLFIFDLVFFEIPITLNLISLIPLNFQSLIYKYLPFELIKKTSLVNISNINIFPRIEIWSKSFDFIKSNLFFGYGAGSFESLYKFSNGKFGDIQHSHNIFLEIAINHGLPSSLIIFSTLISLIFHSWRKSSI